MMKRTNIKLFGWISIWRSTSLHSGCVFLLTVNSGSVLMQKVFKAQKEHWKFVHTKYGRVNTPNATGESSRMFGVLCLHTNSVEAVKHKRRGAHMAPLTNSFLPWTFWLIFLGTVGNTTPSLEKLSRLSNLLFNKKYFRKALFLLDHHLLSAV